MIAIANFADEITAVIAAAGLVIAAVLPVLLMNRRTLKRTNKTVGETAQAVDTNGGPGLGDAVYDISQTMTVVQAQGHENARALYEVHERIGAVGEQVAQVDNKLDARIALVPDVMELAGWVRKQMNKSQGQSSPEK